VLALVIVLVVTNLAALAALAYVAFGPPTQPAPDPAVARVLNAGLPITSTSATRRVISIEILNPLELAAATRGRLAGIAGSIAPGLIRRVVYDQTVKQLRRQLGEEHVAADVRLHIVRPADPESRARAAGLSRARRDGGSSPDPTSPDDALGPAALGPDVMPGAADPLGPATRDAPDAKVELTQPEQPD
jgi:hypothetical protein